MRFSAWAVLSLVVLGLVAPGCSSTTERQRVDFERMRVQQRVSPYGGGMRPPPGGTVSVEAAAQPLGGDSASLIAVKANPLAATPALVARGRDRFNIFCAVCHGVGGFGGSLVAENMLPPRPPSLRTPMLRGQPDGYIFGVATYGKGRMAPYAPQLTAADRWAVVAYIRQLETGKLESPEMVADSVRAERIHASDSMPGPRAAPGRTP